MTFCIDHYRTSLVGCSISCNLTIWFAAIGISVVFSALFAKTYRINKIVKSSKKFRRIRITIWDTLKPVFAVLVLNLIVLTVMSVLDPIQYSIIYTGFDEFGRPNSSYGSCDFKPVFPYLITLALINGGIILFAIYQAWEARNLSTEFAESRYVLF